MAEVTGTAEDEDLPPSPDLLLEILRRHAVARGRRDRMALAFDMLDDWLSHGYPLPADWRDALAGPPVRPETVLSLPPWPGDDGDPGQQ